MVVASQRLSLTISRSMLHALTAALTEALTDVADPGLNGVRVAEDLLFVGKVLVVEHEAHGLCPGVNHAQALKYGLSLLIIPLRIGLSDNSIIT